MSNVEVGVVIGCVFLGIVAWDIYLATDGKSGNTISERARRLGRMWPPFRILLSVAIGVLLGHFFWAESCAQQADICAEMSK